MSKLTIYEVMTMAKWNGPKLAVSDQLRTPRSLYDGEVEVLTRQLRSGAKVDWSDDEEVETDAEVLLMLRRM